MSEQVWPEIVVFGTNWCGECDRTTRCLDERGVPYRYHDVDQEHLSELIIRMNEIAGSGPRRRVPTVVIGDEVFSVPSSEELAQRLGLE
jgi:mycoredoxin